MHQLGRVLHRPGLKPGFAAVGAEDSGFAEKSSVRCFGADRSDRNSGASIASSLTNDNAFGLLLAVASARTSPAAGLALPSVLRAGGDGSLALGLTPVASDPLPDVRRAIPKSDPGILATREELDCLRVHELNFPEIQKQPDPCRFPAQQALQLGHCLSVDPTTQEIEDPSPW